VKRVLKYVQGTKSLDTKYHQAGKSTIVGYADADWANMDDRKSIIGYVFKLQGGPISWHSKKQTTVSKSTCEAKIRALASACQEALWLRNLAKELNSSMVKKPTVIFR